MNSIELLLSEETSDRLEGYAFIGKEVDRDGRVIKKYTRNGIQYRLIPHAKGEKKEGEAELVDEDGRSIALLSFSNGILDGPCKLMHPNGIIQFDGNYESGEKNGFCHE